MIKINEVIVVEGKNDKIKLERLIDTIIIEVGGFRIFKDTEMKKMLNDIAEQRGLIILTDSDSAGFSIRNFIKNSINPKNIKHAYISEIKGKERRKKSPSKEGLLGVEGVTDAEIMNALHRAGINTVDSEKIITKGKKITKIDLYNDGLSGNQNSSDKRKKLEKYLGLPTHLSANALIDVLNILLTYDNYKKTVCELFGEC